MSHHASIPKRWVSLCECLMRKWTLLTGWEDPKLWTRRMREHYRDNPECSEIAERDPVWRARVH